MTQHDPAALVDVEGTARDVLVECARQVRAVRDATPKNRPIYRRLSEQLDLLDAAVARYDG